MVCTSFVCIYLCNLPFSQKNSLLGISKDPFATETYSSPTCLVIIYVSPVLSELLLKC